MGVFSWFTKAGKTGIEEASEKLSKEYAEKAAKEAAEKAVKEAAEKAAKKQASTALEKLAREAAEKAAKEAAEKAAKEAAEKAAKKTLSAKGAATLAAITVAGGVTAYAAAETLSKNGKQFNIVSIETTSNSILNMISQSSTVKITYTPEESIYIKDTIDLSLTNCVPKIEGIFNISNIISKNELEINIGFILTENGDDGLMILNTTMANQLEKIGDDLGDGVGNAVSNIFGAVVKELGNYIYIVYIFIGIIILSILGSAVGWIMPFFKAIKSNPKRKQKIEIEEKEEKDP